MKVKDLALEECVGYESVVKEQKEYFGNHFKNVLHDFKTTNLAFISGPCGDPSIDPINKEQAEKALLNYFIYYCFGVANTVDPKSSFNVKYDETKAEALMDNIEKIAGEQDAQPTES